MTVTATRPTNDTVDSEIDALERRFAGRLRISKNEFFDAYLDLRDDAGDYATQFDAIVGRHSAQNVVDDTQVAGVLAEMRAVVAAQPDS